MLRPTPLLLLAALLTLPALAEPPRPASSPLDPARDPRLARKVSLRAEGIPVAWVLKALKGHTGVSVQALGTAGDERLVAFVPEAPVGEVLERIADLYRLTWTREGTGDRATYRLQKRLSDAREEQALRDRAIRQVLERLSGRLRGLPPPEESKSRIEPWTPVYPELLPLLARRGDTLPREGYIRLPIEALPAGDRGRIVSKLAPLLQEQDRRRSVALQQIREDEIARGIPPEQATHDKPPSEPLQSILTADLQLTQDLQASVGLRTNGDTWYHWFQVRADDLQEPARELYRDRPLRLPNRPGGAAAAALPGDPLTTPVEIPAGKGDRRGDWIGTLGRISDAAHVAIYADCYPNYLEGGAGHPRASLPGSGRGSVAQSLDALCYPAVEAGRWKSSPNAFWWRRGNAALVRSCRWIWEEQTVIPAGFLESVIRSVRNTGGLTAADVPGLANLSFWQLQQGDFVARNLDDWRRAVRIPAQLSAPARQSLLTGRLTWRELPAPEQAALGRLLPGEDLAGFEARLGTNVQEHPAQGGTVLNVSFFATPMRGAHPFYLPLPGVAPVKGLPARGLEVRNPGE